MKKNSYEVDVLVNNKPIKQYAKDGKIYVEAKIGSEYSVRIRNHTYLRKLVVVTIDGINVVSGQPQGSESGRGYIVNGLDSITINGFRKDLNEVGAFKFCDKNSSYCNEKGLSGNNGVIGVRIYDEVIRFTGYPFDFVDYVDKYPTKPSGFEDTIIYTSNTALDSVPNNTIRCCSQSLSSSSNEAVGYFNAGTTWGKKIDDSAYLVNFEANESSYTQFDIYYATKDGLKNFGIELVKEKMISHPTSFGFAKPPSGWNG